MNMLMGKVTNAEEICEFFNKNFAKYSYKAPLHRAVLEENLDVVKQLVESGESVNNRESSLNFTVLHLAVLRKNMEILEYLLSTEGIELDARCKERETPLYLATVLNHLDCVQKLIQAGADVNIPDIEQNSPLFIPVYHPDICFEALHMLLYYNADVNAINRYGCTPFISALYSGNVAAQEALLDYVDDFNMTNYDEYYFGTALSHALHHNSPFVKDIIEQGGDVNYGDDEIVRDLVDYWSYEGYCDARECAFVACFSRSMDSMTFKMVWERLEYNESLNTIDLLRFLDHKQVVPTFLEVITESDNFEPAVRFLSNGDNYFLFVNKFAEKQFDLDQLTTLTCRLLEYGFRASSYDIHTIFSHYGYCELFRILVYMDNDFSRGWLPHMALSRLIFEVNYDLKSLAHHVNDIPKDTVLQLLEYSACPRLIEALTIQYSDDKGMSSILDKMPRVPLLTELARNAARKHIWQSFKIINICQFYTTIDYLDMPIIYKNILKFKRKIYRVK